MLRDNSYTNETCQALINMLKFDSKKYEYFTDGVWLAKPLA